MMSTYAERPDHVVDKLVYDFDFNFPEITGSDVHAAWYGMKKTAPPIFWTPRNGGHWVVTEAAAISEVQKDYEHFSHKVIILPKAEHRMVPVNLDPPEHGAFRKLLMPAFIPKEISRLESLARDIAVTAIEGLALKGECEFIEEFANVLPATVFLSMVGLPLEDRPTLLPLVEAAIRDPDHDARRLAIGNMRQYIIGWINSRRENPAGDLLSNISNAEINGEKISLVDASDVGLLLLLGGLDTVASMLGFIAAFLATHPAERRRLRDEPAIRQRAIEELMRRHGISNTARYVTQDYVFRGVLMKQGDLVQQPNALAGLEDELFPDPLTVDFERPNAGRHLVFGSGPHICPGATLARREIMIFIEEWLSRIPDFEIRPGTRPDAKAGMLNTISRLELVWPVAANEERAA